MNIEGKLHKFKITAHIKNVQKNVLINVCLKDAALSQQWE